MAPGLNCPYGGTLIHRVVPRPESTFTSQAQPGGRGPDADAPVLDISAVAESDLFNLATGAYSPLTGFMGQKDFEAVCREGRLTGSGLPWTIPIVLEITQAERTRIARASSVALRSSSTGTTVGVIHPSEIYRHDKALRILGTFGVDDPSHPGVQLVSATGPFLVAGEIEAYAEALSPDPLAYPSGVRARLETMQAHSVAGFQTRNVVHRAHEYLQRVALEICGSLLVHPVVGWKKIGDFKADVVRHCYRRFMDAYYPSDRTLLAFLNVAMRYAGPKEAVFHAILRKNFGCSHFIVGRDHAGVGGFYDPYAAHRVFDGLEDLGIEILRLREPFYCRSCDQVATDRTCGHAYAEREYISGTKIRALLAGGADPASHIFRPEVLASLNELKDQGLFYE